MYYDFVANETHGTIYTKIHEMKVAVITPDYPPMSIGGCAISSKLLAETLRQKYHVEIFVFNSKNRGIKDQSTFIQLFPGTPKWLLINNLIMIKTLWDALQDFDVIHVYNVSPMLAMMFLKKFKRLKENVKIVMTLNNHGGAIASRITYFKKHRSAHIPPKEKFLESLSNPEVPFGIFGAVVRWCEVQCIRWASKKADKHLALTERIKKEYVVAGYNEKNITVIPNITEIDFVQGHTHNNQNSIITLLLVGRLSPMKGQREFIEAFAQLPVVLRNRCRVRIIGRGKSERLLRRLIDKHNLRNVEIETISHNELSTIFSSADILVHLSLFPEPFSRVWLEAMQHGLAILTSEHQGAREVLNGAALYCNPFDQDSVAIQLKTLIEDSEIRSSLQHKSLREILKYAPEQVQPLILDFYSSLFT